MLTGKYDITLYLNYPTLWLERERDNKRRILAKELVLLIATVTNPP